MWGLSTSEGCAHVRGNAPEVNPAREQSKDPLPAYLSLYHPCRSPQERKRVRPPGEWEGGLPPGGWAEASASSKAETDVLAACTVPLGPRHGTQRGFHHPAWQPGGPRREPSFSLNNPQDRELTISWRRRLSACCTSPSPLSVPPPGNF